MNFLSKLINKFKKNAERSLFFMAVNTGDIEAVKQCLEKGVDLNATDKAGDTAFKIAWRNGHTEIAAMLVQNFSQKGANINAANFSAAGNVQKDHLKTHTVESNSHTHSMKRLLVAQIAALLSIWPSMALCALAVKCVAEGQILLSVLIWFVAGFALLPFFWSSWAILRALRAGVHRFPLSPWKSFASRLDIIFGISFLVVIIGSSIALVVVRPLNQHHPLATELINIIFHNSVEIIHESKQIHLSIESEHKYIMDKHTEHYFAMLGDGQFKVIHVAHPKEFNVWSQPAIGNYNNNLPNKWPKKTRVSKGSKGRPGRFNVGLDWPKQLSEATLVTARLEEMPVADFYNRDGSGRDNSKIVYVLFVPSVGHEKVLAIYNSAKFACFSLRLSILIPAIIMCASLIIGNIPRIFLQSKAKKSFS